MERDANNFLRNFAGMHYLKDLDIDQKMSSDAFMAVMLQVEVFWVVTPCSVVVGCQRFGGLCCFHLQVEVFWFVKPCIVVVGYQRF
jgi:hypothetical protein